MSILCGCFAVMCAFMSALSLKLKYRTKTSPSMVKFHSRRAM